MAEVEFDKEVLSVMSASAPISASRMERITKMAVRYAKNYKAVVFSIERLVTKCQPEHKLSGLYIIDSVVKACQKVLHPHDYANLVSRFEEKIEHMFPHMLSAPQKDKEKMKKLIQIWKGLNLFSSDMLEGIEMVYLPDMQTPSGAVKDSPKQESPTALETESGIPEAAAKNDPRRRSSETVADSPAKPSEPAPPVDPLAALGIDVNNVDPLTLLQTMNLAGTMGIDATLLVPILVKSVATAKEKGEISVLRQVLGVLGVDGSKALGLDIPETILLSTESLSTSVAANDFDYGDDDDDEIVKPVSLERATVVSLPAPSVPAMQQLST